MQYQEAQQKRRKRPFLLAEKGEKKAPAPLLAEGQQSGRGLLCLKKNSEKKCPRPRYLLTSVEVSKQRGGGIFFGLFSLWSAC
jgi:hypothetical protein